MSIENIIPVRLHVLVTNAKKDHAFLADFAWTAIHGKFPDDMNADQRQQFLQLLGRIAMTVIYKDELDAFVMQEYDDTMEE